MQRLDLWLRARVQVPSYFVKLYTHAPRKGTSGWRWGRQWFIFHDALARRGQEEPRFHFHYVTAREMYNLVKAAEAGWTGSVAAARDRELVPNRVADRNGPIGQLTGIPPYLRHVQESIVCRGINALSPELGAPEPTGFEPGGFVNAPPGRDNNARDDAGGASGKYIISVGK